MNNDNQNDELQVEQYDETVVKAKRNKIIKRIGIGVGVAAILSALGYFAIQALNQVDIPPIAVVGGSGSWYASVVVDKEK